MSPRPNAIDLPGCFRYFPRWYPDRRAMETAQAALTDLWEQPTLRLFGRDVLAPRMTAWMGDVPYTYSGHTHAARPMAPWVRALADELHTFTAAPFNAVLINYYRDGADSVGWHADDEPELGDAPVIASLSLGAPRGFCVRERPNMGRVIRRGPWRLELGDGDLMVMSGDAQRDYLHAVPKTSRPIGPRMNLSFRNMFAIRE